MKEYVISQIVWELIYMHVPHVREVRHRLLVTVAEELGIVPHVMVQAKNKGGLQYERKTA